MSSTLYMIILTTISLVLTVTYSVGKWYNIVHHYYYYIITFLIDITVHPQSVNTTLNSTVTFTCEAVTDDIIFRVNDTSASDTYIINKGFIQQPQKTLSDGKKRRVLLVEALIDNNNTNISCRAINSQIVTSDIAVLRIQGELIL